MTHFPETCKDCGARLDPFGICPNASPKDAAIMAAPVHCGKRPTLHPDYAALIVRELHPVRRPEAAQARHYARLAHLDYAEAYRMPRPVGMNEHLIESAYINRAMAIQMGADAETIDNQFAEVRARWDMAVA
jgi:hypothetical protein